MTEAEVRDQLAPSFALLCRAIAADVEHVNVTVSDGGVLTLSWKPLSALLKDHSDE